MAKRVRKVLTTLIRAGDDQVQRIDAKYALKDGVVRYDGDRLYVPYVANLQAEILRRNYDDITVGHFGFCAYVRRDFKEIFLAKHGQGHQVLLSDMPDVLAH